MTAVERILEYCALDSELSISSGLEVAPPLGWPSEGQISFQHVSLSYDTLDGPSLSLRDISLVINGGEKIGIVGRTGAGKSSFIQLLFRMGYLTEGTITIDHVDITSIRLGDVRSRISIIPQDPILFSGTLRYNLDPSGNYSDEKLSSVFD